MSRYIPQTCSETKTYATEEGAVKRAESIWPSDSKEQIHYIIMKADNGRFVPVFIGQAAIQNHIHFQAHVLA